ncbi:MAG: hypothetical protein O9248_01675, partial [Rhodobacteraceae bacterium]|nr:hypothetical protein [Paracoccaceae bacterium]
SMFSNKVTPRRSKRDFDVALVGQGGRGRIPPPSLIRRAVLPRLLHPGGLGGSAPNGVIASASR